MTSSRRTSTAPETVGNDPSVPLDDEASVGTPANPAESTRWGALLVLMATSFVLVTAEFLPSGLLSPMARDLGVTNGQAAQTVTVTALVGLLVAPTIGLMVPRLDRRRLLVLLGVAAAISNLVVAVAPSLWLMLLARFLLGAALSGFWSMSLVAAVRLSRPEQLGRAVMIVTLGVSIATVAGVPLGALIAESTGWRPVFAGMAAITLAVAVAIWFIVPSIPANASAGLGDLVATVRRPGVAAGLGGHVLTVLGHFTAYAFIRLAIERIDGVSAGTMTLLLALFGVGGFAGNLVIGLLVDRHLGVLRYAVPLVTAASILAAAAAGSSVLLLGGAVTVWGAAFGGWLIVVNAWTRDQIPDALEAGGGLVVSGFQLAIMLGAGVGGLLIDGPGLVVTFVIAAAVLGAGGLLFGSAGRPLRLPRRQAAADARPTASSPCAG